MIFYYTGKDFLTLKIETFKALFDSIITSFDTDLFRSKMEWWLYNMGVKYLHGTESEGEKYCFMISHFRRRDKDETHCLDILDIYPENILSLFNISVAQSQ